MLYFEVFHKMFFIYLFLSFVFAGKQIKRVKRKKKKKESQADSGIV